MCIVAYTTHCCMCSSVCVCMYSTLCMYVYSILCMYVVYVYSMYVYYTMCVYVYSVACACTAPHLGSGCVQGPCLLVTSVLDSPIIKRGCRTSYKVMPSFGYLYIMYFIYSIIILLYCVLIVVVYVVRVTSWCVVYYVCVHEYIIVCM